jgi:hypothetical protein
LTDGSESINCVARWVLRCPAERGNCARANLPDSPDLLCYQPASLG